MARANLSARALSYLQGVYGKEFLCSSSRVKEGSSHGTTATPHLGARHLWPLLQRPCAPPPRSICLVAGSTPGAAGSAPPASCSSAVIRLPRHRILAGASGSTASCLACHRSVGQQLQVFRLPACSPLYLSQLSPPPGRRR